LTLFFRRQGYSPTLDIFSKPPFSSLFPARNRWTPFSFFFIYIPSTAIVVFPCAAEKRFSFPVGFQHERPLSFSSFPLCHVFSNRLYFKFSSWRLCTPSASTYFSNSFSLLLYASLHLPQTRTTTNQGPPTRLLPISSIPDFPCSSSLLS